MHVTIINACCNYNASQSSSFALACGASVSFTGNGEKRKTSNVLGYLWCKKAEKGGGGGEKEKETLANKPQYFENRPFDLLAHAERQN